MTAKEILAELKPLGSDSYKKVMSNHGVKEPFFGVKISDLQKIQKRIKKDYQLALDLYDTGNYDAMYLAGLIADDARMTKKDLQRWLANATHSPLASFTVPWVAAGSPHGWELALEWIDSKKASDRRSRLGDVAKPRLHQGRLRARSGGIETAPGAGAEDHSSGTERRALPNELVCHCCRFLRATADGHRDPDRRKDRPGLYRHGQYLMSGPLCARLHPQGAETRRHREEAQVGEMLNAAKPSRRERPASAPAPLRARV